MAATETKQSEGTQAKAQKITTFLMFEKDSVEAAKFYVSVFKNSKILSTIPREGKDMGAGFELDGVRFAAYDGGPDFKFSQGMSLMVNADTQEEIDHFYDTLSTGGEKLPCGWLQDKFGVSWQVTPPILMELLADKDREKADRAFQAMLKMYKIDIQAIKDAAKG